MISSWFHTVDFASLDSPCLVVFPSRVSGNIHRMVSMAGDAGRLRPHIKTHKTAEGIAMMMQAGISAFKCATIAEAELLGSSGAGDVLLAYQPHGPKALRLSQLIKAYPKTKFSCLTDNRSSASAMSAIFSQQGVQVPVYIDLNIGMHRTGMVPGPEVLELYAFCAAQSGINPIGLHAYDGHHRHPDIHDRSKACDESFRLVDELRDQIADLGFTRPQVIMGGSPTFPVHAARKDVQCSPGTSIFWDACYAQLCPEQPFEPAVVLVTRVLSLPTADRICLDAGHKSVAAENDISRRIVFPDAPGLRAVSQSEEHLVLEASPDHPYKPGDMLIGIPYHICPTVALYERLIIFQEGKASGFWKVRARDRSIGI